MPVSSALVQRIKAVRAKSTDKPNKAQTAKAMAKQEAEELHREECSVCQAAELHADRIVTALETTRPTGSENVDPDNAAAELPSLTASAASSTSSTTSPHTEGEEQVTPPVNCKANQQLHHQITASALAMHRPPTPIGSQLSDEEVWSKAKDCLMYTGIPIEPVLIRRAKGSLLWDSNGKEIIDFTSGQMSAILGHSHPEVVSVITSYAQQLDHLLSAMISEPVAQLAHLLTSLLPQPLKRVFFLSTGSEVNEAAFKIAKCATGKFEIVAFAAGYHGRSVGAASATFLCGRKGGGPLMPGSISFPTPNPLNSPFRKPDGNYDWEREMDYGWDMVDRQSVGSLAAFVIEPILSSGGMFEPPLGYFKRLEAECKRRGMLLIDDEAQTGLGRTGTLWGFERDGIVPDILTLSKTLGAGLPQAAVITSRELEEAALKNGFFWVSTHMNDPVTAAVAHKVLSIVIRDNLVQRARNMGHLLHQGLLSLQKKYPVIVDVRGRGLLQGMEITSPSKLHGSDATVNMTGDVLGQLVSQRCMDLGLSCNIVNMPGLCGVFRIAPPLTVSEEEIERAIAILDRSFADSLDKAYNVKSAHRITAGIHRNGHEQLPESFPTSPLVD